MPAGVTRFFPPPLRFRPRAGLLDLGATHTIDVADGVAVFCFDCGCSVTCSGTATMTRIQPGCSSGHPWAWHGLHP